jgi:glycosyltransferase involved in cell wall biosynthesis
MAATHTDQSEPLVSVITPCLNGAAFLERCLASVREQTYTRIEHVVIDGGSSDGTLQLLQRASGVRWTSEPDRSQSDAMNKGLDLATGDVVTFLNVDDLLTPTATARAVGRLRADPRLGFVYGRVEFVNNGRRVTWRPRRHLTERAFYRHHGLVSQGTFVRRWALERVGPLDPDLELEMDLDLWVRLVRAGVPSAYLRGVLGVYELHCEAKTALVSGSEILAERQHVLARHGMDREAQAALTQIARTPLHAEINEHLAAGRYREASRAAGRGLGFLDPVLGRERWSLWMARLTPPLAMFLKRRLGRF